MIKKLLLLSIAMALSVGLPTGDKKKIIEKTVAIVPADREDLSTAETFYSGYNTGYPFQGQSFGQGVGGYGWRGDYKPLSGSLYGPGYGIGYAGVPVGGYGAFVPGGPPVVVGGGGQPVVVGGGGQPVVVGGGGQPVVVGGGGYGWRQGINRWAV